MRLLSAFLFISLTFSSLSLARVGLVIGSGANNSALCDECLFEGMPMGSRLEHNVEIIPGYEKAGSKITVYDRRWDQEKITDVLGYIPKELDGMVLRIVVTLDQRTKKFDFAYEYIRVKDPAGGFISDQLSESEAGEVEELASSLEVNDPHLTEIDISGLDLTGVKSREAYFQRIMEETMDSLTRIPVRVSFDFAGSSGPPQNFFNVDFKMVEMMQGGLVRQPSIHGDNSNGGGESRDASGNGHNDDPERGGGHDDLNSQSSGSGDQQPPSKGKAGKSSVPEKAAKAVRGFLSYPVTWLVALGAGIGCNAAFDALQRRITADPKSDLAIATDDVYAKLIQYYGQATVLITLTPADFQRQLQNQNNTAFRNSEEFNRYGYQFKGGFYAARRNHELLAAFPGCPCTQGPVWDGCFAHVGVQESDLLDVQLPKLDLNGNEVMIAGIPLNVTPSYWCPCNVCEAPTQPSGEIPGSFLIRLGWDFLFVGIPTGLSYLVEHFTYYPYLFVKYIDPILRLRFGI